MSSYQSVPGDGSTYATGFPIAQLYDGVDDGMATAAFAAGTLIDGMDCMIAVRRDSAAAYCRSLQRRRAFLVLLESPVEIPPGLRRSAGTPTIRLTALRLHRGALFTALTVGDWHILRPRP
ncbi:MAG: hypothetical protein IPG23_17560 [Burkholderiales bacterium]|nr:hypothetical protein [Burkholderiales bacterium]